MIRFNDHGRAISVIIPTRDRPAELEHTLRHVIPQIRECDEIIVVDNASIDPGVRTLADRFAGVRWITLPENLSSAARNVAASAAECDILLMLDDDSVPEQGTLAGLVHAFDAQPDLAAIALRIRLDTDEESHDGRGFAGVLNNCGAAIRRDAFLEVGGYPIDFDQHGDEYDLCCRLWAAGWRVESRPQLVVRHARTSRNRDADRTLRLMVRNHLRLWNRYAPPMMRDRMMSEAVDHCRRVAEREAALSGFEHGLALWAQESLYGRSRVRPLGMDDFESMLGLSLVRQRISAERRKSKWRRVGVYGRGAGCPQLLDLLEELGLEVEAVFEDRPTRREWQGWALRDAAEVTRSSLDALIPGTLSLGAAEDMQRNLKDRFPDLSIFAAISWSALSAEKSDRTPVLTH